MNKIDEEVALYNVQQMFVDNLNAKIDAINTEKNDATILEHIDTSNGYAMLTLDEKLMNVDPFLAILIDDIRTVSIGAASESAIDLLCVVIKEDMGEDPQISKKMLRYMRACKEVVEEHFSDKLGTGQVQIANLAPMYLRGLNTSKRFKGAGVALSMPVSS